MCGYYGSVGIMGSDKCVNLDSCMSAYNWFMPFSISPAKDSMHGSRLSRLYPFQLKLEKIMVFFKYLVKYEEK